MNGDHALVGVSIPGVEFIYGIGTLFQPEQLVAGYRLVRIDHLIVVHWKDRIIPDTFIRLYNQIDGRDRKSTRLNSSHVAISYAVFCLKKKKIMIGEC